MNYGIRIKRIRENKGIKAKYVAQKVGLSPSEYSAIEAGRRRLTADLIVKIAEVLGITPDDFLYSSVSDKLTEDAASSCG